MKVYVPNLPECVGEPRHVRLYKVPTDGTVGIIAIGEASASHTGIGEVADTPTD